MSDALFFDGEDAAEIPAPASDISNHGGSDTPNDSPPEVLEDTQGTDGEELAGEGVAEENEAVLEDVAEATSADTPEDAFSGVPEDVPDASLHASEGGSPSEDQDSVPEDSLEDLPGASVEATSRGTDEDVSEDALAERSDGGFPDRSAERATGDSVDQTTDETEASEHQAATPADGNPGDTVEAAPEVAEDAPLQHPSGQSEEQALDTAGHPEVPFQAQATEDRETRSDGQPIDIPSDQTATSQKGQAQTEGLETDDATGRYAQVHSGDDVPGETDYFSDSHRAMETLPDFKPENWERLSLDDKKESIESLADYNADILGIEHKPSIDYYEGDAPGDFGAFSGARNSLAINERNLSDGPEAADTVSHEFRHAYQYQHAQNPVSERDLLFSENFDNYVSPEQDFAGYKDQILESEARDYAQRFRDRVNY